jgi:hypothetical protein
MEKTMINCYTTDLDRIHDALMTGNSDDIELIGNALTALVAIVAEQQKIIKAQQEHLKKLEECAHYHA